MAAITSAVVLGGTALYSANKQANAAKDAAKTQAKGVQNAQAITQKAQDTALPLIQQGYSQGRDAITNGANLAQQNLLSGQSQSIDTLSSGYNAARNDATTGYNQAGDTLDTYYNKATDTFEPMASQGNQASHLQAALSGALGPEEQAKAFANYNESPGQKYLRDQQEQALLRNESALGGGVSANGRILSALQEQADGNAAQNYNTNFGQIGQVADRGAAATSAIANLQAGLGQSKAGIQQQLAALLSGMSANKGAAIAGIQGGTAGGLANLNTSTAAQLAQSLQGQGDASGNVLLGVGNNQAQLAQNLGQVKSSADIYNAQHASPLVQGLQAGIGAYGGMGGNFGSLLSGVPGGNQSDYTGNAFKNFVAGQY